MKLYQRIICCTVGILGLLGLGWNSYNKSTAMPVAAEAKAKSGMAMTTGDFNGDGDLDVLTAKAGKLYLSKNKNGKLSKPVDFGTLPKNNGNIAMICGDFDEDGDVDLVVGFYDSKNKGKVYLMKNSNWKLTKAVEVGSFEMKEGTQMGLTYVDLNGDGDLDLVVGTYDVKNKSNLHFFNNNGRGKFTKQK